MWINPKTGLGWTDEEETAFAEIMAAGQIERLPAIRLYRRCRSNLNRALEYARETAGLKAKRSGGVTKRLKGQFVRLNRSLANPRASSEENHAHTL